MAEAQANRVVVHVDLDAFYAQVEQHRDPERLLGKPVAVAQYNPFGDLKSYQPHEDRVMNNSNGSLIAVSYEARAHGVKRGSMRGDEARKTCPELQIVQVPTAHGKADLTLYRSSGKKVMDILARAGICERASIDECYLDLTAESKKRLAAAAGQPPAPPSFDEVHVCAEHGPVEDVARWWRRPADEWGEGERLLAAAAAIMVELRAAVKSELNYTTSAGIAHNKILAKLASGMHKPAAQTVCPLAGLHHLLQDLPVPKLRQLGGKFGASVMEKLGISTVGELATFSLAKLDAHFGESNARWLHNLARGYDEEEVQQRTLPKSLSCGKTFRGNHKLHALPDVLRWLTELGGEIEERIAADRAANHREPRLLTAHFAGVSRSCQLQKCDAASIARSSHELVKRWAATEQNWGIESLFLGASNFVPIPTGSNITRFMKVAPPPAAPAAKQPANGSSPEASPELAGMQNHDDAQHQSVSATAAPPQASDQGARPAMRLAMQDEGGSAQQAVCTSAPAALGNVAPSSAQQSSAPAQPDLCEADEASTLRQRSADNRLKRARTEPHSVGGQSSGFEPLSCTGAQSSEKDLDLTGDVDEEVLNSLPPELKHEVRLAVMSRLRPMQKGVEQTLGQPPKHSAIKPNASHTRTARGGKRGVKRPASITEFFQKQT